MSQIQCLHSTKWQNIKFSVWGSGVIHPRELPSERLTGLLWRGLKYSDLLVLMEGKRKPCLATKWLCIT